MGAVVAQLVSDLTTVHEKLLSMESKLQATGSKLEATESKLEATKTELESKLTRSEITTRQIDQGGFSQNQSICCITFQRVTVMLILMDDCYLN